MHSYERPDWPDQPVLACGGRNWHLQFRRDLVGGIGHNFELRTVHGACHRPGFRIGYCHRHLNTGLEQIRFRNSNRDSSSDDNVSYGGLLPSIHPDQSNVNLYAHDDGNREFQQLSQLGCKPDEYGSDQQFRRVYAE